MKKTEYLYPTDETVRKCIERWLDEREGVLHLEDLHMLMERRFGCQAYVRLEEQTTLIKSQQPYLIRDSVLSRK